VIEKKLKNQIHCGKMLTKFSIATGPHPDNNLVTEKKTKRNSSWKVSIQFSIAIYPHASHSPMTNDRKKIIMESVNQIFGYNKLINFCFAKFFFGQIFIHLKKNLARIHFGNFSTLVSF